MRHPRCQWPGKRGEGGMGEVYRAARTEADRAGIGPRALLRSWKRGLAMVAVVAAVLLVGVVAQRMTESRAARVVRSVRLTFTGQVAFPALEAKSGRGRGAGSLSPVKNTMFGDEHASMPDVD